MMATNRITNYLIPDHFEKNEMGFDVFLKKIKGQLSHIPLGYQSGIQIEEYVNALTHRYSAGGVKVMSKTKVIAESFLKDPNILQVYYDSSKDEDMFLLIIREDDDNMSLKLAERTVEISRKYPEYYFDFDYITVQELDISLIPSGSVVFNRGI